MSKVIFLLAGFRRTGKDTFQQGLKLIFHPGDDGQDDANVHEWYLLGDDASEGKLLQLKGNVIVGVDRVAFADLLKEEVHKEIGLLPHQQNPVWLEANKDTFQFNGKTLRQHYIDSGLARREQDPTYWVRRAMERVKALPNESYCPTGQASRLIVVTDWRFPNEETYVRDFAAKHGYQVITYRLFRPDVDVPPSTEVSERSLDVVKTDLLIVPFNALSIGYQRALELWPQYADYRVIGSTRLPV